jgi:PAS domain S-box-containing protein
MKGPRRLFGYTAEEMVGEPLLRLIPPDHPDEEPAILTRLRRGERVEHFETVRRHKDGRAWSMSVSISPIRDASGRIVGASKVARDVGVRKRAQAPVDQANERLREHAMVLELAPILVRDMDNRIVLWTRGAESFMASRKRKRLAASPMSYFRLRFQKSQEYFDVILRRTGRWEGQRGGNVDDHAMVREGLKRILLDEFKDASFGEAGNATEALEQIWKGAGNSSCSTYRCTGVAAWTYSRRFALIPPKCLCWS